MDAQTENVEVTRQEEVLAFLETPKSSTEVANFLRSKGIKAVTAFTSQYFRRGLVLRSEPVKFYRKNGSAYIASYYVAKPKDYGVERKDRKPLYFTVKINDETRTLAFYGKWNYPESLKEKKVTFDEIVEFVKNHEAQSGYGLMGYEIAKHFGVHPRVMASYLGRMCKATTTRLPYLYKAGRLDEFGLDKVVKGYGYAYGTTLESARKRVKLLLESEELSPYLKAIRNKIDQDSREGRITLLESLPVPISTASRWTKWLVENDRSYESGRYLNIVYVYNKTVFVGSIEKQVNELISTIEKKFRADTLYGIVREIISRKGLSMVIERDKLKVLPKQSIVKANVVVYTPFGNELDLVALLRLGYAEKPIFDIVLVFEAKSTCSYSHVVKFWNKIRHVTHPIEIAKDVKVWLAREIELEEYYGNKTVKFPVHILRSNVIPILIVGGWDSKTKDKAQEFARKHDIIWLYSEQIADLLSWLLRRRITMNRIEKLWRKTDMSQFVATKRMKTKRAIEKWLVKHFLKE